MGICDDGPYILVAKNLALTGHIAYNGWSAAMLCWQLYLAAACIKLFGFSFTAVRMSTLFVAVLSAFLLQRVLVRCGVTEGNAVVGTLALALSPLYLLLSVTFMSDIHGLFGIVLCIYTCIRALQSTTDRAAVGWLCLAIVSNVAIGTSRQLTWLGVLVMVPCTLWLLRERRSVLLLGAVATAVGFLGIFACLLWLGHQPYTTPERFGISDFPVVHVSRRILTLLLEIPFLLLPIMALLLLGLRRSRPRTILIVSGALALFALLAVVPSPLHNQVAQFLEPTLRDSPGGEWITVQGVYEALNDPTPRIFVPLWLQVLASAVSYGGVIVLCLVCLGRDYPKHSFNNATNISWLQLGILLGPFAAGYIALLAYRAASVAHDNIGNLVFDRYAIGLLPVVLILLTRLLQERVEPRYALAGVLPVAIVALYSVAVTHNTFSLYRARVALAAELRANGIPDTAVDNGWEYNLLVELQHSSHINNSLIKLPADAYVPPPAPPTDSCYVVFRAFTPHVQPIYGVSFAPDNCYGPTTFAPVHYSRWPTSQPGTLYVVRYRPSAAQ
jgi:hypothetical protein